MGRSIGVQRGPAVVALVGLGALLGAAHSAVAAEAGPGDPSDPVQRAVGASDSSAPAPHAEAATARSRWSRGFQARESGECCLRCLPALRLKPKTRLFQRCPPEAPMAVEPTPPAKPEAPPTAKAAPPPAAKPAPAEPPLPSVDLASTLAAPSAPVSLAPNMIGDFLGLRTSQVILSQRFLGQIQLSDVAPASLSFVPFRHIFNFPAGYAGVPGAFQLRGALDAADADGFFSNDPNVALPLEENSNLTMALQSGLSEGESILFISGRYQLENDDPRIPPPRPINVDNDMMLPGADTFTVTMLYELFGTIFVDVPSPSGGGAVGRFKIAENNSPIPRRRVYFNYSHFYDVHVGQAGRFNINRFVFGLEQPFLANRVSAELRIPFAGTLDSRQVAAVGVGRGVEFGNVAVVLKGLAARSQTMALAAGLGLSLPTADDSAVALPGGPTLVEIENRAVLVQPFLGTVWAPTERFFVDGFAQIDFETNGNPVLADPDGNGLRRVGVLTDSEFMLLSAGMGYWLLRDGPGMVNGVAPIVEIHYNTTLGDPDLIVAGGTVIGDLAGSLDILNLTTGTTIEMFGNTHVTLAMVFPLRDGTDRQFDWEAQLQINRRFGPADPQASLP